MSTGSKWTRPLVQRARKHASSLMKCQPILERCARNLIFRLIISVEQLPIVITLLAKRFGSVWRRVATSISTATKAGIQSVMRHFTTKRNWSTGRGTSNCPRKAHRWNGPPRKHGFSGCPNMKSNCSNFMKISLILSAQTAGETKRSALSRAACVTCLYHAQASTGALRFRAVKTMSCMSGSTR